MCCTVKQKMWKTNSNTSRWKFLQKYNMFVAQIGCAAICKSVMEAHKIDDELN